MWRGQDVRLKAREKESLKNFRNIDKIGNGPVVCKIFRIKVRLLEKRSDDCSFETSREATLFEGKVSKCGN